MKKILFILFLLVAIAFTFYNHFILKEIHQREENTDIRGFEAKIASDYLFSLNNNGLTINTDILVRDINDFISPLNEKCVSKRTLIFRYSYIHCDACVDNIIELLNDFSEEVGQEKVLILSHYANKRDYKNFVRINRIKQPIYDVSDTLSTADNLNVPYMFILEDDFMCNNFFIPRKENSDYVKMYFKSIKHLLK